MPAKKQITKELIIKESLIILKEQGSNFLNARNIAEKLKCSTQPIYLNFKNMDELKNVLKDECKKIYFNYVSNSSGNSLFIKYLSSLVYFAYESPNYFKYLYMEDAFVMTKEEDAFINMMLDKIMEVGHVTKDEAYKFYMAGFIVAYGLASQIATGYINWQKEDINKILNETFSALKLYIKGEKE